MGRMMIPSLKRTEHARQVLRLFELHGETAYRTAYGILGSEADAQDAVQDVFLYVLRKPSSLRKVSSTRAWLHRAAANAAVTIRRSRASRRRRDAAAQRGRMQAMDHGERHGEETAAKEQLRRYVADLPEKLQLAVVLHYFQGLSCKEMAKAIPCPVSTATTRLERARTRLRERLARGGLAAAAPIDQALSGMPEGMPGHVSEAIASNLRSPPIAPPRKWSPPTRLPLPVAAVVTASVLVIFAGTLLVQRGGLFGPPQGKPQDVSTRSTTDREVRDPRGSETSAAVDGEMMRPVSQEKTEGALAGVAEMDTARGLILTEAGAPIPHASVEVAWHTIDGLVQQDPKGTAVTSGLEGRFSMPPSGYPLMLEVSHRDHATSGVPVPSRSAIQIVLQRGIRHTGIVLDATSGAPVGGASVKLSLGIMGPFKLGGITVEVETGEDGRFEAPLLPGGEPRSWVMIAADHPDYLARNQWSSDCQNGCKHVIPMVPPSSHRLVVSVRTPEGAVAPPGTRVDVVPSSPGRSHGEGHWSGLIDAHGEARFQDLGPGYLEIWAAGPGYARGWELVEIRRGENKSTVALGEGEVVTGRVISKETRRPLAKLPILVYVERDQLSKLDLDPALRERLMMESGASGLRRLPAATTDTDGRFSFRLPRGGRKAYSVGLHDGEHVSQYFSIPEAGSEEWVIELMPLWGRQEVTGQVIDSEDKPIPGAILLSGWWASYGLPDGSAATTDGDGRFLLRPHSQFDHVIVRAKGFVDREFSIPPLMENPAEIRLWRRLLLSGYLSPPPEPGEILTVFLLGGDEGFGEGALVAADGGFTVALSENDEGRLAVNDYYLDRSWETDVTIPTKEKEVVVRWRKDRGVARGGVSFTITNADTGELVQDCNIYVAAELDPDTPAGYGLSTRGTPGKASHGGIPVGQASASLSAPGYLGKKLAIEVVTAQTREFHVVLQPDPALARGNLSGTAKKVEDEDPPPGEGPLAEDGDDEEEALKRGNGMAAIGALRTIASVQRQFQVADREGDGRLDYASSLEELGNTGMIDKVLASGTKSGYLFSLSGSQDEWMASATPIGDETGIWNFIVCTDGVVRFSSEEPADCSSPPIR